MLGLLLSISVGILDAASKPADSNLNSRLSNRQNAESKIPFQDWPKIQQLFSSLSDKKSSLSNEIIAGSKKFASLANVQQQAYIKASGFLSIEFGRSVSISGNTLAVGLFAEKRLPGELPRVSSGGAVYIFNS